MTKIESKYFKENLTILIHPKKYYLHHHVNQRIHQIIENNKYKTKKARKRSHKFNFYNLEKVNNAIKSINANVNKNYACICNTQIIKWHK
jgi:hypothetical protein